MDIIQTTPPTDVIRRRHDTDPSEGDTGEPAHHARRPMNAFLIFCKRHRSVVRDKYPSLENRSITKILGEWWANLEEEEKASYTGLAKQYKDAFFNANPDFKWYKLPAPPLRTLTRLGLESTQSKLEDAFLDERKNNNSTQIDFNKNHDATNISSSDDNHLSSMITLGKLANEAHMGGLTSLMHHFNQNSNMGVFSCSVNNNSTSDYGDHKRIPVIMSSKSHPCETFIPSRSEVYSIRAETENLNNHVGEIGQGSRVRMKTKDMTSESNTKLQDELSETTRIFEKTFEMNVGVAISHNLTKRDTNINNNYSDTGIQEADRNSNFTPQQLINQVVDKKLCTKEYNAEYDDSYEIISLEETNGPNISTSAFKTEYDNQSRSGRACKGKRYQEFMAFGGLKVNKRQRRECGDYRFEEEYTDNQTDHNPSGTCPEDSESPGNTDPMNREMPMRSGDFYNKTSYEETEVPDQHIESTYYGPEQSFADSNGNKMFKASDFDLDAKIRALPSLSLEKFQQKKRDNKKRKRSISMKSKEYRPKLIEKMTRQPSNGAKSSRNVSYSIHTCETPFNHSQVECKICNQKKVTTSTQAEKSNKMQIAEQWRKAIIGSQKRKPRKISITRLAINSTVDKTDISRDIDVYGKDSMTPIAEDCTTLISEPVPQPESQPQLDLFALATLAEIASNTSKLDETK